ncbi:MAG: NADAR family protein [Limnothrix sp.]
MESKAKVIYFYKAYDPYGCFSNFSPHPIQQNGHHWPTVEHFYQAQKFASTADAAIIPKIHQAPTPEAAAAIGRSTQYSPRHDWPDIKQDIMWQGLLSKFSSHADIAQILINTENATIIENSPVDYYWGCGADGKGHNHLGKLLMAVREILRDSVDKSHFTQ